VAILTFLSKKPLRLERPTNLIESKDSRTHSLDYGSIDCWSPGVGLRFLIGVYKYILDYVYLAKIETISAQNENYDVQWTSEQRDLL